MTAQRQPGPAANGDGSWQRATPTGAQLEAMPLSWFRAAIDQLLAETVPEGYWRKVIASQAAQARRAR